MERVKSFHAPSFVCRCEVGYIGGRQRTVLGGRQYILRMRLAVGIRILRILYLVRGGSNELKLTRLTQLDQDKDCFSFEVHAGLRLVVERTLDGADVEVESHAMKLRLRAVRIQHSVRNA